MATKINTALILGLTLLLAGALAAQEKPEDIPDAPSATRPIPPPSPRQEAAEESTPDVPPADGSGVTTGSKELPRSAPDSTDQKPAPPPMPPVRTVPAGSVPKDLETGQDLYTITVTTNLVTVPVTVTDREGRMIGGLLPQDFLVLENGQKQTLKFFTSDPFALSAAVIFDTGMADVGLKKVQETLSALQGAFSPFDEVGIYTYSSTVGRVSDFTTAGKQLTATLNQVKGFSGANNGPAVTSGPLGPQGPIINGIPMDSPVNPVSTPPKVARVLNDAILLAARDLSKRDRARRKIIFIISDGFEQGSVASYKDTLKVLLTQNITVYAVGVEGAAIPVYDRLQRIHIPKTRAAIGYSDILPKYVNATGGGTVYGELAQAEIERAYARAIGDARNQYTLGYSPRSNIGGYREIEVQVKRPGVKVYARRGYYPLPTAR
ncbi:MAG TPA: VWA domain-containing protein [Terriglobales bacterium]|nr:VWA domain-containing protein [Terriglobales bacterium]